MKEDNNKAKFITVGIAVVLIIIIAGICVVIGALNNRNNEDSSSKLQSDIIEYANQTNSEQEKKKVEKEEPAVKVQEDAPVIVEQMEPTQDKTILDEEKESQSAKIEEQPAPVNNDTDKTQNRMTAEWQKDAKEDLSTVKIDLSRQLSEMKGYWEASNMEAVEDLAYLPRYRAASKQLADTTKYYYYGDTDGENRPSGKGLAMYTDNQYYYGEWKDGVRSGSGMWIKYYVYDQNAKAKDSLYLQHSYSGTWENDLPSGEGAEHYDFIDGNLEPNVGYNRNFIGGFKDGLYNGEIYITDYYSDGNSKEWSGTAVNGVWQHLGQKDKKGQYPIIVQKTNLDNYQWIAEKENKNNGVDGLISAAKAK